MSKKIDPKQLKAAAKEMNEVMGLDPKILTVGKRTDDIVTQVKSAIKEIEPDDVFSEETLAIIALISGDASSKKADKTKKSKKEEPEEDFQEEVDEEEESDDEDEDDEDEDEEEDDEEEDDEDEDEEEDDEDEDEEPELTEDELVQEVKEAKSLVELTDLAKSNDVFKPLVKKLKTYKKWKLLQTDMLELLVPEDEDDEDEDEEEEKTTKKSKSEKKETKKEKKPRGNLTADRIAFFTPLIEAGKYTKAQLMEKGLKKEPSAKSGIQTLLTDAKNPKYNRFDRLVVQDEKGVYSFEATKKTSTKSSKKSKK